MRQPFRIGPVYPDVWIRRAVRWWATLPVLRRPHGRHGLFVRTAGALALKRAALRSRLPRLRPMDRLPDAVILAGLAVVLVWAHDLVGAASGPPVRPPAAAPAPAVAPASASLASDRLADGARPLLARVDFVTSAPAAAATSEARPAESEPDEAVHRVTSRELEVPVAVPARALSDPLPKDGAARAESVSLAGVWGPDASACDKRNAARTGMIPMTISRTGAKAGDTTCTFSGLRQTGAVFEAVAACRRGGERWSSKVRIAVRGDRLTWSSKKGVSAYVRCDRMMVAGR